jgi:hypothetical protein
MKRRHFVASVVGAGLVLPTAMTGQESQPTHGRHGDTGILDGLLANATVSFGAWPPQDRLAPPPPGVPPPNVHQLTPNTVTIRRGGTVNFIVAGLHNVVVYGPGKDVDEVKFDQLVPTPGAPPGFPGIIEDPELRVFRGAFAFGMPVDRVEVVQFPRRGRHLVICGFAPHFNANEKMYGWVVVL